jgi:hypothetical protein
MPRASDRIAIVVTNGFFRIERNACLRFMPGIETVGGQKGYRLESQKLPS